MKVIKIEPQGFCQGVSRALKILDDLLENPDTLKPIYVLGNIIHNKKVVKEYENKGIITIHENNRTRFDALDDIKGKGSLVISAHGASRRVKEKAIKKGLKLYDASCPYVNLIQNKIIDYIAKGYTIYYIGTKGHPECEGVLDLNKEIHLIEASNLEIPKINDNLVYITNQTTLSSLDLKEFYQKIKLTYKNIIIDDKICHATTLRQSALLNQEDSELLFVVGDKLSSNSKKLLEVSKKYAKIDGYLIEDINDIKPEMLKGKKIVSVTSGASTPSYITDEVINYLKNY